MVLPLDVTFLVSNSLNMHSHNQQLLEMASAGTAIVIPAWETTVPRTTGRQIATDLVQGKHPMLCYLQAVLNTALQLQCASSGAEPVKKATFLPLSWTQSRPHLPSQSFSFAALP